MGPTTRRDALHLLGAVGTASLAGCPLRPDSGPNERPPDTLGTAWSPPHDEQYAHDRIDDNADAHLRAMLLGESVSVPVSDGELDLGTWQSVLFVECDGPRTRSVTVTVAPA
ncbi:secondary thiamine-phosphate synthase enzyme YjbQ [Halarchaeum sp. P4]|uniref:secondary thiamine-phosphate synthase enzyme YjbQ n=1 Tax=Halarchaeum sp. P4 TaxID=3421639 RepID=UPI003EBE5D17